MDEFPKTNNLIPKLLKNSKEIIKNIKGRIKVNSMIEEFNSDIDKDFKKLVSMSTRRYKATKIGNKVSSIIKSQEKDVSRLLQKINKEDIYINKSEIKEEKEKLNKNINIKKKENLKEIRDKIKISSKYQSLHEIEDQNKKLEKIKKTRVSYLPLEIQEKMKKEKIKKEEEKKKKEKEEKGIFYNYKGSIEELVSNLLDEDIKVFNSLDNNYKEYLKLVQQQIILNKQKRKKIEEENKNKKENDPNKKRFFEEYNRFDLRNYPQLNKINTLYFKDVNTTNNQQQKVVEDNIDFQKLFKYTKKGKAYNKRLNLFINSNSSNISKYIKPCLTQTNYHNNNNNNNNDIDTENMVIKLTQYNKNIKNEFKLKSKAFDNILEHRLPFVYSSDSIYIYIYNF